MSLVAETVSQYTQRLASDRPTPGGGSAAAVVGALAAAAAAMAANFTVGKKKFADVQADIERILAILDEQQRALLDLADADADAYSKVGSAYGMPRDTDEQKQARQQAIQEALMAAAEVPTGVVEACAAFIGLLPELADKCNSNLISDVGVSAELGLAALRAAQLNVEVNLAFIKDGDYNAEKRARLAQLLNDSASAAEIATEKAKEAILA